MRIHNFEITRTVMQAYNVIISSCGFKHSEYFIALPSKLDVAEICCPATSLASTDKNENTDLDTRGLMDFGKLNEKSINIGRNQQ